MNSSFLLPNLSMLTISGSGSDDQRLSDTRMTKRRKEEDNNTPSSSSDATERGTEETLDQVNWSDILDIIESRWSEYNFELRSSFWPDNVLSMRMTKGVSSNEITIELTSDVDDTPCVEISMYTMDRQIFINSLFYTGNMDSDLRDEVLGSCNMSPEYNLQSGAGAMVISFVQSLASLLNFHVALKDHASIRSGTFAPDNDNLVIGRMKLSHALAMLRGFGYYEARGFMPKMIADPIFSFYDDDPSVIPEKLMLAKTVLVSWTHMIATTPLINLLDAIRSFDIQVDAILGPDPKELEDLRRRFSKKRLTEHYNMLSRKISPYGSLVDYITEKEKLGVATTQSNSSVPSLTKLSIRKLLQLTGVDKTIFNTRGTVMAYDFIQRVDFLIESSWRNVNRSSIFDMELRCDVFPSPEDPARKVYIGVQNPLIPSEKPSVSYVYADRGFTVRFEK